MNIFSTLSVSLISGIRVVGANGKVNNMVKPYEAAKYDAIVISDSGIKSKSFSKVWLNKN